MAFVHFDSKYAPSGFLIVRDGHSPYDDKNTVLIQTDWDFPGVASTIGWVPCECGETDGTVDCPHKKATNMISEAYDFLRMHADESFPALDEYLQEPIRPATEMRATLWVNQNCKFAINWEVREQRLKAFHEGWRAAKTGRPLESNPGGRWTQAWEDGWKKASGQQPSSPLERKIPELTTEKTASPRLEWEPYPWGMDYHEKFTCEKCGTVNTCRCNTPKKNILGICPYCAGTNQWMVRKHA